MPVRSMVLRAFGLRPVVRLGWGAFFGSLVGDRRLSSRCARSRWIPFGRLTPLPTPPPNAARPPSPSSSFVQLYTSQHTVPVSVRGARPAAYHPPTALSLPPCRTRFFRDRFSQTLCRIRLNNQYGPIGISPPKRSSLGCRTSSEVGPASRAGPESLDAECCPTASGPARLAGPTASPDA